MQVWYHFQLIVSVWGTCGFCQFYDFVLWHCTKKWPLSPNQPFAGIFLKAY